MKITNRAPIKLYFEKPEFYLIQSNYKGLQEIVFTDHPTREILEFLHNWETCVVAVFKVKPRAAQPVDRPLTNMDIAEDIIYESRKNKAA